MSVLLPTWLLEHYAAHPEEDRDLQDVLWDVFRSRCEQFVADNRIEDARRACDQTAKATLSIIQSEIATRAYMQ